FILLFLPVAVISYYCVAGSAVARQWVLIAASLVFYGWWDARFIPLLVGQIGATWLLARLQPATRRDGVLVFGIIVNLPSLPTFKYLDFLLAPLKPSPASPCRARTWCCRSASASFRSSPFPIWRIACARMRRSTGCGRSRCSCCYFRI